MHKRYLGRNDVIYQGYNEGKGIWGRWEIKDFMTGGFHIWPKGMGDPTERRLTAEADLPADDAVLAESGYMPKRLPVEGGPVV